MNDSISRQGALDAVDAIGHIATMPDGDKCIRRSAVKYTLSMLPSAQPEHDAEFWRKRAEEYSNICLAMTAEMTKGIKFNSIRIDENGICFGKEQPEQKWIPCSERLPEVHEIGNSFSCVYMQSYPVLVYGVPEGEEECSFHVVTYCDDLNGYTYWSTELDAVTIDEVKAWMPLPKPYRGGGTT